MAGNSRSRIALVLAACGTTSTVDVFFVASTFLKQPTTSALTGVDPQCIPNLTAGGRSHRPHASQNRASVEREQDTNFLAGVSFSYLHILLYTPHFGCVFS